MENNDLKKVFIKDQIEGAKVQAEDVLRATVEYMSPGHHYDNSDEPYNFLDTFFGEKYKFTKTKEGMNKVISCKHIIDTPSIIYSNILFPHLFSCAADNLEAAQKAAKKFPDKCDFCETNGHSIFSEFVTTTGPMIINGNVCVPCLEKQKISVDKARQKQKK